MTQHNPSRHLKISPEVIFLAVMLYARFPFSPRDYEDLLPVRGTEVSGETVLFWRQLFGPMFAVEIGGELLDRCAPPVGGGTWTRCS